MFRKKNEKSNVKVIKTRDWMWFRLKEVIAMIVVLFLWLLRISFIPSLLLFGTSYFATTIVPSMAIQVYNLTRLSNDSGLADQFAFFYLPMLSFVFIFGLVVTVLVCYTEYVFWKKCQKWIQYWFAKTNIKSIFKRSNENGVSK